MHSSVPTHQDLTPAPAEPRTDAPSRHGLYVLLIGLLWLALYVPGLFTPPLLDDADSIHAEAAREMIVRHDWSTLYINGFRYLEKAPLMYWAMCVSYKIFGVSTFAARLPLSFAMLAALFGVYFYSRRFFGAKSGFYATIVLGLSFGPYIFTRILIPDILVGFWLTLGGYFFLRGLEEETPSLLSCWGLAATAALDVLTKGLIGIVFPIGIIVIYLFLTRNLRHLLKMRLLSSFLVFMAIAAPWHIVAGINNPAAGQSRGFFWFYFINEHVLRYINKRIPKDYDTVPFAIFWGALLIWIGPWTMFMFKALARVPHKWSELTRLDRRGRATLFAAIWAALIFGFFSFSSRQEYYILPALPALAIIIGNWMADEEDSALASTMRRAGRRAAIVLIAIAIPAAIAALTLLMYSKSVPAGSELADALKKNPEDYALSFGHFLDLTGPAMGFFRIPLLFTAIALFFGSVLNFFFRRRHQIARANTALALMMLVFLTCAHQGLVIFSPVLSSKTLSDALAREYHSGDTIVVNGEYEDASTLNFYGHFPLHVLNARGKGNLYYGSLFPDSPKAFEDDASLAALWSAPNRVFLWTEEDKIPAVVRSAGYKVTAHSGGKYILVNR
jgi:4-amino-4-deoxy-L-arabinose transferase-like glycosyltransferase